MSQKKHEEKKSQIIENEPINEDNFSQANTIPKEVEYLEMAQRIKAEFENYKKRNAEIVSQSFDNGIVHTITKLLPAIDSFKQASNSITDESTLKGLNMVLTQILTAFEDIGVTKIKACGEQFDPNFHNAVLTGNDQEQPDGLILEEYQEGFIYKGERVVRYSVVKINKLD